jgi:segregation and condensation protein A
MQDSGHPCDVENSWIPEVSDRRAHVAGNLARVAYNVHTDVFAGPFDLLLRLITEQRVDLYEVALADIVDGFLAEVEAMQRLDLEVATEFLVIASTLVELKCRRLLPDREEPDEESLALLEERDYLLARLVECTTFSAAGAQLAIAELAASRSWPRLAGLDERFEGLQPDLLACLSPEDLREAALRALEPRPRPHVEVDHVLVDEVTVAEVVKVLCARLPGCSPTTFRELTAATRTRMELVVHFLGLLELYKQGLVELEQAMTFGELRVLWTGELCEAPPEAGDVDGALQSHGWGQRAPVSLADLDYRG